MKQLKKTPKNQNFESKYGLVKKISTLMQNEGKESNKYEKLKLKPSIQWSLLPILNSYTLGKELSGKLWNKYIYGLQM